MREYQRSNSYSKEVCNMNNISKNRNKIENKKLEISETMPREYF